MNIKDALRKLVDVTRLIDANECGELYNELQSALYVAGEALHDADTNKPADMVDTPEFRAVLSIYNIGEMTEADFIAHIDAHVAKAVAAEREACAKVCEIQVDPTREATTSGFAYWHAKSIRARA